MQGTPSPWGLASVVPLCGAGQDLGLGAPLLRSEEEVRVVTSPIPPTPLQSERQDKAVKQ